MSRNRNFAILLILAIALFATGCGSSAPSPLQQTIQARQAYTLTLSGLNAAHRLGYLPTPEKVKIEPFRAAAAAALDAMEQAALAGATNSQFSDFSTYVKAFSAAFDELAKAQLGADKTKAAVDRVKSQPTVVDDAPVPSP